MKLCIFGSRTISDKKQVEHGIDYVAKTYEISEIVSGGARGADVWGESIARDKGIPVKKFPADWKRYGKRAGYLRNKQMAEYADIFVGIWDGSSRGTKMMMDLVHKEGKPLAVFLVRRSIAEDNILGVLEGGWLND